MAWSPDRGRRRALLFGLRRALSRRALRLRGLLGARLLGHGLLLRAQAVALDGVLALLLGLLGQQPLTLVLGLVALGLELCLGLATAGLGRGVGGLALLVHGR